ncbi:MAG: hypothetical protein BWY75_01972 [bacterium ADurb.Bin425]|nr:MAG: hypothetical protein BWY75_01972 [bacterium ADurb.Bin425]
MALARGGVEAQLLAVDLDRSAEFQLTGRESQVVGGHQRRVGEFDALEQLRVAAVVQSGSHSQFGRGADAHGGGALNLHRRQGGVVVGHIEGDLEGGLHFRLVEAGEGATGVGGFELGGGNDMHLALIVRPGGTVEALQLVVELAGESQLELPLAGAEVAVERNGDTLQNAVERHRAGQNRAVGVFHRGLADGEVVGVERDRGSTSGVAHIDVDGNVAPEGQVFEVGRQLEFVVKRPDVAGKAILAASGNGLAGDGEAVMRTIAKLTHSFSPVESFGRVRLMACTKPRAAIAALVRSAGKKEGANPTWSDPPPGSFISGLRLPPSALFLSQLCRFTT